MVADKVEIDTLSYQKDAEAAKWICTGGIDYEMEQGTKTERGTSITLYLGEDGKEFLEESTLYNALKKYCSFMPVPIFIHIEKEEEQEQEEMIEQDIEEKATRTRTKTIKRNKSSLAETA